MLCTELKHIPCNEYNDFFLDVGWASSQAPTRHSVFETVITSFFYPSIVSRPSIETRCANLKLEPTPRTGGAHRSHAIGWSAHQSATIRSIFWPIPLFSCGFETLQHLSLDLLPTVVDRGVPCESQIMRLVVLVLCTTLPRHHGIVTPPSLEPPLGSSGARPNLLPPIQRVLKHHTYPLTCILQLTNDAASLYMVARSRENLLESLLNSLNSRLAIAARKSSSQGLPTRY